MTLLYKLSHLFWLDVIQRYLKRDRKFAAVLDFFIFLKLRNNLRLSSVSIREVLQFEAET